jgi:hypothetical protein
MESGKKSHSDKHSSPLPFANLCVQSDFLNSHTSCDSPYDVQSSYYGNLMHASAFAFGSSINNPYSGVDILRETIV